MKSQLAAAILTASALFGAALPASAAIVDVTYTGSVYQGWDQTGIFGIVDNSGNAYVGDSFVAKFMFDTTMGNTFHSPNLNYATGGSGTPYSNPALGGSVTVNGDTYTIDPIYGEIEGYHNSSGCCTSGQIDTIESSDAELSGQFVSADNSVVNIPASITAPLSFTDPPYSGNVVFTLQVCSDPLCDTTTVFTQVFSTVETFTVTSTATPLPSTWLMLLSGFLGLGFFAYRGSKKNDAGLAAA